MAPRGGRSLRQDHRRPGNSRCGVAVPGSSGTRRSRARAHGDSRNFFLLRPVVGALQPCVAARLEAWFAWSASVWKWRLERRHEPGWNRWEGRKRMARLVSLEHTDGFLRGGGGPHFRATPADVAQAGSGVNLGDFEIRVGW